MLTPGRAFALCAVAAALLYAPLLSAGFAWDDEVLIPYWIGLGWDPGALLGDLWPAEAAAANELHFFRPLMALDLMVCAGLLGDHPGAFHAVSAALHLAVGAALFLLIQAAGEAAGLARAGWIGAGLAGAFLLHPAHQEAVAFVAARNDLWAALWALLAALAWLGPRWWLAPGALAAGLLFKESAAAALVLLPALDLALGRRPWRRLPALLGAAGLYAAVRIAAVGWPTSGAGAPTPTEALAYLAHGGALLSLARASAVHQPLTLILEEPSWWLPGALALGALAALLLRSPLGRSGLALWLASCLPALPVAAATGNAADRYFYQADLGLFLGLAPSLAALSWSRGRALAGAGLVALLGVAGASGLPRWSDSAALWLDSARHDPTGYSWAQAGRYLEAQRRYEEAIASYRAALERRYPDQDAIEPLGVLLFRGPAPIEGCPYLAAVAEQSAPDPERAAMLATCERLAGRPEAARGWLQEGLAEAPGLALLNLERLAQAQASADREETAAAREALAAAGVSGEAIAAWMGRYGAGGSE